MMAVTVGADRQQARALQEVAVGLLSDHLGHCVLAATRDCGEARLAGLDEVASTIRQVVRL